MTDKEKKPTPHFVPPPTRPPKTWHSRNMQKPAKKPEKTTAEVIEILERHIELMKTVCENLTPGVPLSVVARPEVEALSCIKRLQAQLAGRKPKRITCKECNKRYTFSCALYYGNVGDKHYFLARGGGFSCSWGEPRIERLTKGHLDGLSAKITTIDELHEIKNNDEGANDERAD